MPAKTHDPDIVQEISVEVYKNLLSAIRPLAAAAESFQWVKDKNLDQEGVFLWSQGGNPNGLSITVGDIFRACDALEKAERLKS